MIKIQITKAIITHKEEMAAHDKVTKIVFNNRVGVIYDT